MKLIWHIVRKDCRRLWLPLSLWLLLLLAHTALLIHAWGLGEVSLAEFQGLRYFSGTWGAIILAIGFILAAWLVMEDSLVVITAFWATRPISGGRLLAAKAAGALLLLSVLPVLVLTPVWLLCGFSAGEWGRAALDLAVGQGILSIAAFAVACITATSGQFLVRTVGALIVLPLCTAFALGKLSSWGDGAGMGLAQSRTSLVFGLLLVTPLILIVYQFLTRRTSRSYLFLGLGLLLMLGVRYWWSWDFSQGHRELPAQNQNIRAVQEQMMTFNSEQTIIGPDQFRSDRTQIRLQGEANGAPRSTYVRVNSVRGGWGKANDWLPLRRNFKAPLGPGMPPARLVRQIAGLSAPENVTSNWSIDADEPGESVEHVRIGAMKLQLDLNATLMRGRVLGELPLRSGAELQQGASITRLMRIDHVDGKVLVFLAERDASPRLVGGTQDDSVWSASIPSRPSVDSFLLLNRPLAYDQFPVVNEIGFVSVNSILVGQRQLIITPPTHEVNGRIEEIPDWEVGAVIVKIRFQPEHDFTRPLTVEPLANAARP